MQRCQPIDEPTECCPLQTVDELLKWEARYENSNNVATNSIDLNTSLPSRPRTLVCHDFKGGYLEDKFPQGCASDTAYRFFHWPYVDMFVYFSHHFVTIPPPCWTNAAHKHNVFMLGTVITEWKEGEENCRQLLSSEASFRQVADQLVLIATHYGFDGWLINIENKIQADRVWLLREFVHYLTRAMHSALPHSQVIWYDSVIDTGDLKWQDQLCEKNKPFFDACDGIFLNYCWDSAKLESSQSSACVAERPWDVYVGVDVFGRGCLGGGEFNTSQAIAASRDADLSAAIFAPGWVFEAYAKGDMEVFTPSEYKFWRLLSSFLIPHPVNKLPFYTDFCQGQGHSLYRAGKVICDRPWTNLTFQSIQPLVFSIESASDKVQTVDFTQSFQGGACLKIGGQFTAAKDYFYSKLYSFETAPVCSLGPQLLIAYSVQCPSSCVVWMDVEMEHTASEETQTIKYRLCSKSDATALFNVLDDIQGAALAILPVTNNQDLENVILMENTTDQKTGNEEVVDNRQLPWDTRCFTFSQLSTHTLKSLSVGMLCTDQDNTFPLSHTALLGQIQISNTKALPALPKVTPEVTSSQISQDEQISHLISVSCELQWCCDLETEVNHFMVYCTKVPRGKDRLSVTDDAYWQNTKLIGRIPRSKGNEFHTFKMCELEVSLDACELLQFRVQSIHYNGISQPLENVPVAEKFLSLD